MSLPATPAGRGPTALDTSSSAKDLAADGLEEEDGRGLGGVQGFGSTRHGNANGLASSHVLDTIGFVADHKTAANELKIVAVAIGAFVGDGEPERSVADLGK